MNSPNDPVSVVRERLEYARDHFSGWPEIKASYDAALAMLAPQAEAQAVDEPDMVWLHDDGETFAHSVDDIADQIADDMRDGDESIVKIDTAVRSRTRQIRVRREANPNPDEDGIVRWEYVTPPAAASSPEKPNG